MEQHDLTTDEAGIGALGADLEAASNVVRDRVFGALDNLPPVVEPLQVWKEDRPQPILNLWVRSDSRDLIALSRLADDVFVERLRNIPGVSRVDIWGGRPPAMRLWLDPQRLAAYPPLAARRRAGGGPLRRGCGS